jgi:hypothetical protein
MIFIKMPKNLLKKIIPSKEDINNTCFNMTALWLTGKIANTVSNSVFHFDLNKYNSIDHLVMGIGIGTLAYRKAGKGVRGVVAGLIAGTMFNAGWEYFENKYVFKDSNWMNSVDTMTDIAFVYAGNVLGFLGEKAKGYINRKNEKSQKLE